MSTVAISRQESSMMKSRGKANDLCSLICAYRLLENIVGKERLEDPKIPPMHKKMGVNFSKNEVRSYVNSHLPFPYEREKKKKKKKPPRILEGLVSS